MSIKRAKATVRSIGTHAGRENLDVPLDQGVTVTDEGAHHKIAVAVDGKMVSSAFILDFEQQIGNCTVRMAGIGNVWTVHGQRKKGYARRMLSNMLRWVRQEGFDTTMLFGIPRFYPKFGYVQAFPDTKFTVSVRDTETLGHGRVKFVSYKARYLPALLRMHERNNAGRTGPVRRPGKRKPWRREVRVALSELGRPIGYFSFDVGYDYMTVFEVGWTTRKVFPDIALAAARIAAGLRLELVTYRLSEDHPLMEFCSSLRLRKRVTHRKDSGAQVRMVNIHTTLAKLVPDIGPRLRGSGSLNIATNLDSVSIVWSRGRCRIGAPRKGKPTVRMPQWALAQLVYGYRTAGSMAIGGTVKGSAASIEVVDKMFPIVPHSYYNADRF